MNILIDARMVGQQVHGIGRYTADLIHGLNEIGHNVSVIACSKNQVEYLGPTSVKDFQICPVKFASPGESIALSHIQNADKYDVIHFPSFSVPLWAPWEKVVITIHDLIHLHGKKNPFHQIYYKSVVGPAMRKSRRVIAVSEWTKKEINEKLGTMMSQISVVRNGVEAKWFEFPSAVSEEKSFVALTNLKLHKNVGTLIEACRNLWGEGFNFKLYLSLSGQDLPSNWNLTSKEKEKITVLKNASDEEVKNLMACSAAVISTSVLEGFNYPAAEALALGKPAIISQGAANDELSGERLFFYGKPYDIEGLINKMKMALQQQVHPAPTSHNVYSRKEMAQRTVEAYKA